MSMKYVVLLCDGMSDLPVAELNGQTPMMAAYKPNMDYLAGRGEIGLLKTIPEGMKPGSDVANLSVLGYDPAVCYTGRSPLEAASIGVNLLNTDVAFRCNLVTLSDHEPYERKYMLDYCADDISSEEAAEIMETVQRAFGGGRFDFYPGVSYRHCMVWHDGDAHIGNLTPPHDISSRVITDYLSDSKTASPFIQMMRDSYPLLKDHPVNQRRIARGKRPANSIWLWGQGTKPVLSSFREKFGLNGSIISAVDLLKGIGKCAGMSVPQVPGATGYLDTNWAGKTQHALNELRGSSDFVYIHIEAPDECGHRGEVHNKVKAIELIDEKILASLMTGLKEMGDFRIMILPDHPTPLSTRTHSADPVPYLIYDSACETFGGVECFNEESARKSGIFRSSGPLMMNYFLGGNHSERIQD